MERHELNRYKVCDRIVVGVCSMSENLAVAYCSSSEQQHHSTTAAAAAAGCDIALCRLRGV